MMSITCSPAAADARSSLSIHASCASPMWPWPSARRGGIRTQTRAASQSSVVGGVARRTGVVAHAVLSIEQQQPPARAAQRPVVLAARTDEVAVSLYIEPIALRAVLAAQPAQHSMAAGFGDRVEVSVRVGVRGKIRSSEP